MKTTYTPMLGAWEATVDANFVYKVMRRHGHTLNQNELEAALISAGLKAYQTYKPSSGCWEAWYISIITQGAWKCVRHSIGKRRKAQEKAIREVSYDTDPSVHVDLSRLAACLEGRELEVFELKAKGFSVTECAGVMGITHQRVSQYWKRAEAKMKELLADEISSDRTSSATL